MSRFKNPLPVLLTFLLLFVSTATAGTQPSPAPDGITVGDFALQMVRLVQDDPALRASMTPEKAIAVLERAGLRFQASSGSSLTEGEMSAFFQQAGILLQTARPDHPVSSGTAGAVLSTFAGSLSARTSGSSGFTTTAPPDLDLAHVPLPEDFSDCAALPTVPECRVCCLSLPGTSNRLCGRACGRAHAAQTVSASEPTP